jgi:ArsR family transcriptional regulator
MQTYIYPVADAAFSSDARWQLYRLLAEPLRLRLLALARAEELSVGELAELLSESQPNVSRHAAGLRQSGVLLDRREGTRVYVRVAPSAALDPVVADALQTGRGLCERDGSLARIVDVVRSRDHHTREFFEQPPGGTSPQDLAQELPAYLFALGEVMTTHDLAVDAGTGDGSLLDVLAPVFDRVVALDRSRAQLARARRRVAARGYRNVELLRGEMDGPEARQSVGRGADVVVCSRVLHHSPLPRKAVGALAELARPGGALVLIDYLRHQDEELRDHQADVWMGFSSEELEAFAQGAGLVEVSARQVPSGFIGGAPDSQVGWQVLTARRPSGATGAELSQEPS